MDVLFVSDRRNLCWILPPDSFRFARPNEPLARFSKQIQILQACEHYTYSNVIRTLYFSKKTEILFVIWGATVFRAPMFFVIFFNGKRKHIEMQWANERCLNSSPVELKTIFLSARETYGSANCWQEAKQNRAPVHRRHHRHCDYHVASRSSSILIMAFPARLEPGATAAKRETQRQQRQLRQQADTLTMLAPFCCLSFLL